MKILFTFEKFYVQVFRLDVSHLYTFVLQNKE